MSKTPDYIIAFAEAVYPGFPELGLSMTRSEESILRDATKVIATLQSQLAIAEKKLAIAESGLAMVKALDRTEPPEEVSDYEQGVISGFEMAAEIACKAITEIEVTK